MTLCHAQLLLHFSPTFLLLLLQEHARHLSKQSTGGGAEPLEGAPWTGLGSDHPAQVEGLRNVQAVSLGGVHAMAIIDDDDDDDDHDDGILSRGC